MTKQWSRMLLGIAASMVLGACAQIVGIDDPKSIDELPTGASSSSSSGSGASSSGTSNGGPPGPWITWPMPNGTMAGLPNQSNYTVDAANDVVTDNVTGLQWQRTLDATTYLWDDAKAYCDNLVLAGYDDWRLPWRIELVSLIDYNQVSPVIDPVAFPNTPTKGCWSASLFAGSNSDAWFVWFFNGDTYATATTNELHARCVR